MATPSTLWFNSSYTASTKSGTYGDTIQVYIKRSSSTYRHKIFAEIRDGTTLSLVLGDDWDESTGEGASTATKGSYASDITDWGTIRAKLDSGLTLSPNSVITFYLYTYDSSNRLVMGSPTTRTINMSLPSNVPSIPYCTTAPSSGDQYIQGYSKMDVSADIYAGSSNGNITSFRYSTPGGTYIISNPTLVSKGNGFYQINHYETNNSISKYSGSNQSFTLYVTNNSSQTSDYYHRGYRVVPYVVPKITAYGMSRYSYSNGTWTPDDSGEYLKFYYKATVNDLSGNTGTFAILCKKATEPNFDSGIQVTLATGVKSYTVDQSAPHIFANPMPDPYPDAETDIDPSTFVKLSADYSWTIRFSVTDSLGRYTSYQDMTLAVGLTTLDFLAGGKGVAVGKVAERITNPNELGYDGLFDVGFDTRLRKNALIDGALTVKGDTTFGDDIHVVGVVDLDNPLSIQCGGTGSTEDAFTNGDMVVYDSSLGGYLTTTNSGDAADWLGLGNLAFEDDVSVSDIWGLGELATLDRNDLGDLAFQNSVSLNSDVTGTLPVNRGGTGSTTASGARSNLGLGHLATQDEVDLNSDTSGFLPISNGGTGATDEYLARYNLGFYSNTKNIYVSSSINSVNIGPLPEGVSDDYIIVATPNQDTGSQCNLYWYIKRSSSNRYFQLYVIDKAGVLNSYVTFGWIAMKIT